MSRINKLTALLLTIAVTTVMLFSALFIAENNEHNCTGNDCQICEQVQLKLKVFNNQTPKPEDAIIILSIIWSAVLVLGIKTKNVSNLTLIDLKTKLSS